MCWRQDWPSEYHNLLDKVLSKLGLITLYLEKEVSGKSGARTFRAEAETDQGIANPVVLKIGDVNQIAKEQKGYSQAENHFRSFPSVRDLIEVGDLSCLVMRVAFNGRGQTLRACFNELHCDQLKSLIEDLFESVLQVDSSYKLKKVQNPFKLYDFQTIGFVKDLRAAGDSAYTLLDWWNHAQKVSNEKGTTSFIHGDLHSNNILVKNQNIKTEISLLDFGSSGLAHAFRDYAKLERDIWLFVNNEDSESVIERCKNIESELVNTTDQQSNESIKKACIGIQTIREIAKKRMELKANDSNWWYEYLVALIWQFMLTARKSLNPIDIRSAALARAMVLKSELEEIDLKLKPDKEAVHLRKMEDRAWKFAYSFLRLDQLPGGAWSRTLPMWMEAIWEGEHGTVIRSPDMRINGGVDSTGYAISIFKRFWMKIFYENSIGSERAVNLNRMFLKLLDHNTLIGDCVSNLEDRVSEGGGVNVGVIGRGKSSVKVRHSIIGLLTDLNCRAILHGMDQDIASSIVEYLIENHREWKKDTSHLFGMYASGVALWSFLKEEPLLLDDDTRYKSLRDGLSIVLKDISRELHRVLFTPKPDGTYPQGVHLIKNINVEAKFFIPYYQLWRMERSNALMFLPYLISADGSKFIRNDEFGDKIINRIIGSLLQILDEVKNKDANDQGLIQYYKKMDSSPPPCDWGLSAELLVLLEMPVIIKLLARQGHDNKKQEKTRESLYRSLLDTFEDCANSQRLFKFSHGLSCGAFLGSKIASRICPEHVAKLDKYINEAARSGHIEPPFTGSVDSRVEYNALAKKIGNCTELALYRLASVICSENIDEFFSLKKVSELTDEQKKVVLPITELLVSKLEAGEHAPDIWDDQSHARTIKFFDSQAVKYYLNAYKNSQVHDTLLTRLLDVTGILKNEDKVALDLGCGPGDWGKWLYEHGFEVHLLDDSKNMLEEAEKTMNSSIPPNPLPPKWRSYKMNARNIDNNLNDGKLFGLITANALMVHIPPKYTGDLLIRIFNLLKPGGRFFVNFKLRDHTLISLDGRYFSYYKDAGIPEAMLRSAGFEIHEIALRWNNRTLYGAPKSIQWANFYCRRPLE